MTLFFLKDFVMRVHVVDGTGRVYIYVCNMCTSCVCTTPTTRLHKFFFFCIQIDLYGFFNHFVIRGNFKYNAHL